MFSPWFITLRLSPKIKTGPLADSREIKGFFTKAVLDKIKVVSLKILQK